jgi:hypothetical protein
MNEKIEVQLKNAGKNKQKKFFVYKYKKKQKVRIFLDHPTSLSTEPQSLSPIHMQDGTTL